MEGLVCSTPLQCFKESFKRGIIEEEDEKIFFDAVEKRNTIVHIYGVEQAKEIYEFLKQEKLYYAIKKVYEKLKSEQ